MRELQPLCAIAILAAGCGSAGPTRLELPVELVPSAAHGLANDHGYAVTLSKAQLRLEALRFFSGEPLFAARLERLWRTVLGVRCAHAHPGHYQEGEALAELLAPRSVDLLAGATLGAASGVSGRYRSAQLVLGSDAALGGSVVLEGTATKAGAADVAFRAALAVSDAITGITAGEAEVMPPLRVALAVDLARFVQRVDFAALGAAGADVVQIAAGTQAENALRRGVLNTSAYSFSWSAGTP